MDISRHVDYGDVADSRVRENGVSRNSLIRRL